MVQPVYIFFPVYDEDIYDIPGDRIVRAHIVAVGGDPLFTVQLCHGKIGGFGKAEIRVFGVLFCIVMHVLDIFQNQVFIIFKINDKEVVLHGIYKKRKSFTVEEICHQCDQIRTHFDSPDISHGIEIVQDSPVHGDDGKAEIDFGEELPDCCRCLFGGDGVCRSRVLGR